MSERIQISCPNATFSYIYNGKKLLVFGSNDYKQLGLRINIAGSTLSPTELKLENAKILQISCGANHVLILKTNGEVWGCGNNYYGQLGRGNNVCTNKILKICDSATENEECVSRIIEIRCASHYSVIWRANGDVQTFGYNSHGQLGFGDQENRNKPTTLINLKNIRDIQCGEYHTVILTNEELLIFGFNLEKSGHDNYDPVERKPAKLTFENVSQIKSIHCGGFHSMILMNNGDLFVCGLNHEGQLGLGHQNNINKFTLLMNDPQIELISLGIEHSFIKKRNGEMFVFGSNKYGQLGLNSDKRLILKPTLLMKDSTVQMISCCDNFTLIYKSNGEILSCGRNYGGQLGLGNTINQKQFQIVMKSEEQKVLILNSGSIAMKWKSSIHSQFPESFQQSILTFICCLRTLKNETKNKVFVPPKFILWKILENFYENDFPFSY